MTEEQQLETDFPEAWKPEPGEKIAGSVVSITMSPDFGYGPYPIVTLNAGGRERAVHAFHQILRTELARRRPRIGDEVEIAYQGKRSPKSGNGNPFHVYRVTGGQEREFNWDSELPESEREAIGDVPIAPTPRQPVPAAQAAPEPAQTFGVAPENDPDDLPF